MQLFGRPSIPSLLLLSQSAILSCCAEGTSTNLKQRIPLQYLYDDNATSFPVIEYKKNVAVSLSSSLQNDESSVPIVSPSTPSLLLSSTTLTTGTTEISEVGSNNSQQSDSMDNNMLLYNENEMYKYRPSLTEYRVVQFYDSIPSKCRDCVYFKEYYVKLAVRINEILRSTSAPHTDKEFKVSFYSVSCPHNPDLCRAQLTNNEVTLPVVRLYKVGTNDDIGMDINYNSIHPYQVLERLGITSELQLHGTDELHLMSPELEEQWSVGSSIELKRNQDKKKLPTSAKIVNAKFNNNNNSNKGEVTTVKSIKASHILENDVNRVLDNLLRHYIHQPVAVDESLDAKNAEPQYYPVTRLAQKTLTDFLTLLHKTLPQSWKVHVVLKELLNNIAYIAEDRNYLIEFLKDYQDENTFMLVDQSQPWSTQCIEYNKQYSAVYDSAGYEGSYTCGFWELLHTVANGLVQYNTVAIDGKERLQILTTMETIRDFLLVFNGGGMDLVSRSTLLYLYQTCAHDSCNRIVAVPGGGTQQDWIQLPLWFNEIQNFLNVQIVKKSAYLRKRIATTKEIQDVQRPSIMECPSCWEVNTVSGEITLQNNDMIEKYLKLQYGPQEDLADLASLQKVVSEQRRLEDTSPSSSDRSLWNPRRDTFNLQGTYICLLAFFGIIIRSRYNQKNALLHRVESTNTVECVDGYIRVKLS